MTRRSAVLSEAPCEHLAKFWEIARRRATFLSAQGLQLRLVGAWRGEEWRL